MMASRSKREATEAIGQLKRYLQRDQGGLRMLSNVERYMGELRQTQSKLKAQAQSLEASSATLRSRVDSLQTEIQRQIDRLEDEQKLHRQADVSKMCAENYTASLQARIAELETEVQQLRDDIPAPPSDLMPSMDGFERLFQALRARLKTMPLPHRQAGWMQVYDIRHFVTHYDIDECITLGLLTSVCSLMNQTIAFEVEGDGKLFSKNSDMLAHKRCKWMRKWIRRFVHWTPNDEKLRQATHPDQYPRPGQGRYGTASLL